MHAKNRTAVTSPLGETKQNERDLVPCPVGEAERPPIGEGMPKRAGHIRERTVSDENIREAYRLAARGRSHTRGVRTFRENEEENLQAVKRMLEEGTFESSPYHYFQIHERGKTRDIASLLFFPDRVVHWALTLATRDVFVGGFISQTYAAIPGRGTHQALRDLKRALRHPEAKYCLKVDVHHYFESIDKDILMEKVERRIKDPAVLGLYREIVYGYPRKGIPIGNLTSQYLANLYLSDIDHYFKEQYRCRWYFRYMDDIVILGWSTAWLRRVRTVLERKLAEIGLSLNRGWQIFPTADRGVDFVGYRSWRTHTLLRTGTKRRMARKMTRIMATDGPPDIRQRSCAAAYHGILLWCDGTRLHRKYVDPVIARMEAYT